MPLAKPVRGSRRKALIATIKKLAVAIKPIESALRPGLRAALL